MSQQYALRSVSKGAVVWFTGLCGSGKSTLAQALEARLSDAGVSAFILDGDVMRTGLNSDLGFSPEDREENIRRLGEVAKLFASAGVVVLVAAISPYASGRDAARRAAGDSPFVLVHLATPIDVCEVRDPKGLYAQARAGKLMDFTGVDAPYEQPENADLTLDTSDVSVGQLVEKLARFLEKRGVTEGSVELASRIRAS